jgi:hypothetical protein
MTTPDRRRRLRQLSQLPRRRPGRPALTAAEGRVKGLKLYPGYEPFYVHDPRMRVVYELAGEFGVPVMIHTGDTYDPKGKVKYSHPIEVDEVAVDFRDVTFVICHLGNPWITDAMEVIYKNPNVVGDISGFTLGHFEERFERFMLQQVNEVVAFAGDPSKLLYGTDWPICDMGSYIRFVNNLHLTPEENDLIFWRNSAACSASTCRTRGRTRHGRRDMTHDRRPTQSSRSTTSASRSRRGAPSSRRCSAPQDRQPLSELRSELAERRLGMFSTLQLPHPRGRLR